MEHIEAQRIDLKDWAQSGEGWNAVTYYHRTDETLLLKLNSVSMPYEQTLAEFRLTRGVHDLGARCPATFSLVTDGERYGILTERFVGKKSFARILSEQPEMSDALAKDMADAARALHSLPCDTALFESLPERLRSEINSCPWIKRKVKALLNEYADGMRPVTGCVHGDMHPGNILRTPRGDFWIDLGRFGYGDPDMDYASQYMLAHLAPAPMVKWILHLDSSAYAAFVERFGQYYYGEDFNSPETKERLRRAVCLTLGHAIVKSKSAAMVYSPYILGHERFSRVIVNFIGRVMKLREG